MGELVACQGVGRTTLFALPAAFAVTLTASRDHGRRSSIDAHFSLPHASPRNLGPLSPLGVLSQVREGASDCKAFLQKGFCAFGITCAYNHPVELQRKAQEKYPFLATAAKQLHSQQGQPQQPRPDSVDTPATELASPSGAKKRPPPGYSSWDEYTQEHKRLRTEKGKEASPTNSQAR